MARQIQDRARGEEHHQQGREDAEHSLRGRDLDQLVVRLGGDPVPLDAPVRRGAVAGERREISVGSDAEHRVVERHGDAGPPEMEARLGRGGAHVRDLSDAIEELDAKGRDDRKQERDGRERRRREDEPPAARPARTGPPRQESPDEEAHAAGDPGPPREGRGEHRERGRGERDPEEAGRPRACPRGEPGQERKDHRDVRAEVIRVAEGAGHPAYPGERGASRPGKRIESRELERGVEERHREGRGGRARDPLQMARLRGQGARGEVDRRRGERGLQARLALVGAEERRVPTDREDRREHGGEEKERDRAREGIARHILRGAPPEIARPGAPPAGGEARDLAGEERAQEEKGPGREELGLGKLEDLGRAAVEHHRHEAEERVEDETWECHGRWSMGATPFASPSRGGRATGPATWGARG